VLHTDGSTLYDGTGSAWLTDANGNPPDQNGVLRYSNTGKLIADSGWTFGTFNGTASIMHMQANEINFQTSTGINLVGNVSASGTITARNIIPEENPTGGIQFNPSSTDVLSNLMVSGSVTASGNISASGVIKGAEFQSQDQMVGKYDTGLNAITLGYNIDIPIRIGKGNPNITISGNITASGDISASGTVHSNFLRVPTGGGGERSDASIFFGNTPIDNGAIWDDGSILSLGYAESDTIKIKASSPKVEINGDLKVSSHITASGNISASGEIHAASYNIDNRVLAKASGIDRIRFAYDNDIDFIEYGKGTDVSHFFYGGAITASGNISSSGIITATSFVGNMDGGTF
jgi:phage baseplate assembly protein gpV